MKKVLLVVIDALAARVVRPAMEDGRLPNLHALAQSGWVDWQSTAIFPSITPAATAALVTGGYTTETGVSGAYFYDYDQDRIHYYGDDIWTIITEGFGAFFEDFLVHLNNSQLRAETLFQQVERAGGRAASLNYLWYRGDHPQRVHVPWMLKLWPGVPFSAEVLGPTILSLGDFVSTKLELSGKPLTTKGGARLRFGFYDEGTAELLVQLAREGPLPNLTVAYFPENDYRSHDDGPEEALSAVAAVDDALGKLIAVWGSLPKMLQEVAVIVTGDHSQSELVEDEERRGIPLEDLLADFTIAPVGREWHEEDELMVCPNLRAAQIYVRPGSWPRRRQIADALLCDPRIDQVIWREDAGGSSGIRCRVATSDRGTLDFWPAHGAADGASDEYGTMWQWSGELGTVDARLAGPHDIVFGDYPNALERIVTAFDDRVSGDFWVTARPGFEFCLETIAVHRRGSHGSLHALDSLSPLIAAGAVPRPAQTPRSVDVPALCLSVLGLPSPHPAGASHVAEGQKSRQTQ